MSLCATPFHARTAAANQANAWLTRNGFTICHSYSDPLSEALAARVRVGMADVSARWRVMLEGPHVVELLQRLITRNPVQLMPGQALKALWLNDAGGLRGCGTFARHSRESFMLHSASRDARWIASAAALFGVGMREVSADTGGLAVFGPRASAVLESAGLKLELAQLAFRRQSWRGVDIVLSRLGDHSGYEIWCAPDDALVVWDRVAAAGQAFGMAPIGAASLDILDLEAGIPRAGRDFLPAEDAAAIEPAPRTLGLDGVVDPKHVLFNGRTGWLKSVDTRRLVGIEIDSETAAPHVQLRQDRRAVGRTLSSVYSPALRRAIALAQVEEEAGRPGTALSLTLPTSLTAPMPREASAQVAALPFLGSLS